MSYYTGPDITSNNLIMCVDAANTKSYSGTGTAWNDLCNNGMGVTVTANYNFNALRGGSFLNTTSGDSGGMTVSLTNFSKTVGTMEFWASATSWNDSNGLFVNRADTVSNAADWLWFGVWSGGSTLYFRTGDGTNCCNNDLTVNSWSSIHPTGVWGQYVVSWSSGNTARIYFNGRLRASRSISSIPSTNPSATGQIGIGHTSTNSRWLGYIASVKMYNRQLTDAEISQNYNAVKSKFGL